MVYGWAFPEAQLLSGSWQNISLSFYLLFIELFSLTTTELDLFGRFSDIPCMQYAIEYRLFVFWSVNLIETVKGRRGGEQKDFYFSAARLFTIFYKVVPTKGELKPLYCTVIGDMNFLGIYLQQIVYRLFTGKEDTVYPSSK